MGTITSKYQVHNKRSNEVRAYDDGVVDPRVTNETTRPATLYGYMQPKRRDFTGEIPDLYNEYLVDTLIRQIIRGYGLANDARTYYDVGQIVEDAVDETKRDYPPTEHEFYARLMDALYVSIHKLPVNTVGAYVPDSTPCDFARRCHDKYGTTLPSFGPCMRADDGCVDYTEKACDEAYQNWQACLAFDPIRSNCISKQQVYDACSSETSAFASK